MGGGAWQGGVRLLEMACVGVCICVWQNGASQLEQRKGRKGETNETAVSYQMGTSW